MFKSMSRYVIVLCVVAIVCVSFSASIFAQSADIKIGFVDLQRIIDSSEGGKRAQVEIKKRADELNLQAKKMKEELQVMKENYDKQADVLTEDARIEKLETIRKLELEYNRFMKDSREEIGKAEQWALKQLLEDIGKLVVEYGRENGYTLIVEAGTILYGADSINLTDEIIKLYNLRKQ